MKELTTSILYAEDDIDDRFLMSESASINKLPADVIYVSNGDEAISYLEAAEKTNTLPVLIVLDVNMPKRNGKQTLEYIKSHPHFSAIPVVMLSTSENAADVSYYVQNGAALYFKKPVHFSGYHTILKSFSQFLKPAV